MQEKLSIRPKKTWRKIFPGYSITLFPWKFSAFYDEFFYQNKRIFNPQILSFPSLI
jgi:hypothetical protein